MAAALELSHLGCHGRLAPFFGGAGDEGFGGEEGFELAADGGGVVVAGDFGFDFGEGDIAPVALGGFGVGDGVNVLFVGGGGVFGGGFGVGFFAV